MESANKIKRYYNNYRLLVSDEIDPIFWNTRDRLHKTFDDSFGFTTHMSIIKNNMKIELLVL